MTKIKVIKTEEDYLAALVLVEDLISKDPEPESEDGEKLELLATLVEDYENKTFPENLPDPIDAILFRMEQQNLKASDLVPYFGSRSKVSEVLARKRPLTLSIIRSLASGLGIPAKVLLIQSDNITDSQNLALNRFPLKEIVRRGYLPHSSLDLGDISTAIKSFFQPIGSPEHFVGMLRKTSYRSLKPVDKHALVSWAAIVTRKALEHKIVAKFNPEAIDISFMRAVAKLSIQDDGPIAAIDFLSKSGIALIIEPHFPKTYLDGATIMIDQERPIIGLTLKHDRLDNFWFTLMHEIAHIALHYNQNSSFFYDDLDSSATTDEKERDADKLAGEALVPENKWENSPARLVPSPLAAESLAREIGVHIAIVAGKMRREGSKYIYLNSIVNQAKVRTYFPELSWSK